MIKKKFFNRTLTGLFLVIFCIAFTYVDKITFTVLLLVIMLLSLVEYITLIKKGGRIYPQSIAIFLISIYIFMSNNKAFALSPYIGEKSKELLFPLLFLIPLTEVIRKHSRPIHNIAYSFLGIIYIAIPITLFNEIAYFNNYQFTKSYNPNIILSVFFLIWTYDTGAFIFGTLFGKQKLFPRISPNKTWAGLIGGGIFAIVIAYIIAKYYNVILLQDWLIITIIIIFFGTFGDLFESMIKRQMGVKDSGKILIGHGGILDRFDSLLFSVPFIYWYLKFLCAKL